MGLLFWYFIITGIYGGFCGHCLQVDADKQAFYFCMCFLTGWFVFPIKVFRGFKKCFCSFYVFY